MSVRSLSAILLVCLAHASLLSQGSGGMKNFNLYKEVVPGVDFFASNREATTAFQKPLVEARERLTSLLGPEWPRGAIFICSSLAQKDSFYEPRAIKMGYKWVLVAMTPEVQAEEMMARLKAQLGDQLPADRLERIRASAAQRRGAAEAGIVRTTARNMAFAVLQTTLQPELAYRSTRVDDMGRSPLPDWLDIGIASYSAAGGVNVRYLQDHLEEVFPLDDVVSMSRPFVAPTVGGSGGPMIMTRTMGSGGSGGTGSGDGASQGGAPPNIMMQTPGPSGNGGQSSSGSSRSSGGEGRRFGGLDSLPKDQKDRMLFDSQASTFFSYLVEKIGLEKVKALIQHGREGKESAAFLTAADALGADMTKVEEEWAAWVKTQKAEPPPEFRMRMGGDGPASPR